ncbi:pancreatic triacylglycerol lipase-like [Brachionus plicatilis]|uniref:Pancreatic triacylglycerol lipase-like n=1 Tax=Brachionus plicatilis TaxID=10195 RepID=A0A3M7TAP2_BRAPC|nr:pancreatic triacylglycerol lipase-like [Brachionus plicatilis]
MQKFLFLLGSLILGAASKEICYDQLGCFTDSYPFSGNLQRPFALLPQSPQKVSVKFTLYNKVLGTESQVISYASLGQFNPSLKTKFIVHGFIHNGIKDWVIDMKNKILRVENVNVIVVDWSKGNGFPYTQATANTQIVGAEIARLINTMISSQGAKAADFHIIGHSLGSHIAGYAGERVNGLGRITALDPAGPYFENTDPKVRLDPTDAVYVDAIHSDGTANLFLGLGLIQPIGHVDFYPNGGKDQPDCGTTSDKLLNGIFNIAILDVEGVEESLACSHMAAVYFFTDSITSKCKYSGFQCNSKDDFDRGNCMKCSSKGCNRMGYWSSPSNDLGTLYLNTQAPLNNDHYCKQNFKTSLVSNSKDVTGVQARGKFTIFFETSTEMSSVEILDDSNGTFKPESTEIRLVSLNEPLMNPIENLYVFYKKTNNFISSWLYEDKWSFRYIQVLNGDSQTETKFCPTSTLIYTDQTVKFRKC